MSFLIPLTTGLTTKAVAPKKQQQTVAAPKSKPNRAPIKQVIAFISATLVAVAIFAAIVALNIWSRMPQ
jgi:hypothetical protein